MQIELLEAIYFGGCRMSSNFKQISTATGLISLTGITIPSKQFMMSSLSQKPIHKLTGREKVEYMNEMREKEFVLVYVSRKVGSTTEM